MIAEKIADAMVTAPRFAAPMSAAQNSGATSPA